MTDGPDRNLVREGADAMIYGLPERLMDGWMVADARNAAALVIAAVEPLIHAKATAEALEFCCEDTEPDIRRAVLDGLQAKAGDLRTLRLASLDGDRVMVDLTAVLAMIEGARHETH